MFWNHRMQYFGFCLQDGWIFKCSVTWYCWLVNSYKWFREACCFILKASVYIFSCHERVMWPFWEVWSDRNIKQVVLSVQVQIWALLGVDPKPPTIKFYHMFNNCGIILHTYEQINQLNAAVLDKLTFPQIVKKLLAFYGTWRFITVCTRG